MEDKVKIPRKLKKGAKSVIRWYFDDELIAYGSIHGRYTKWIRKAIEKNKQEELEEKEKESCI